MQHQIVVPIETEVAVLTSVFQPSKDLATEMARRIL